MKTVVITGCNRGLGEGIKEEYLSRGYRVIGLNRSEGKECNNYVEHILDISSEYEVKKVIEKISAVDILVLNAGIRRFEKVENLETKDWLDSVNTNLNSVYLVSKVSIPKLKESAGDIIIIGSHSEKYYFSGGSAYSSTKLAIRGFSETLMDEVREYNIRVSYLSLGAIKNREHIDELNEDWKLTPNEVGNAVYSITELPKKVLVPYIDIRPIGKREGDLNHGIDKLQYV